MKAMRKLLCVLLTICILFAFTACSSNPDTADNGDSGEDSATPDVSEMETDITFMASPQGGAWYGLSVALSELLQAENPDITVTIGPGGGSSNLIAANAGECELAITTLCTAADATKGRDPFTEEFKDFRFVCALYPQYNQFFVPANSDIQTVYDLKGKHVSVMPVGFAAESLNREICTALGWTYEDFGQVEYLGYAETIDLMKDNRLDCAMFQSTLPHSSIMDIASSMDIRFLPFDDDLINKIVDQNFGISKAVMPAGSYPGQNEDIQTIESPLIIIAHKDTSEALTYQMAKVVTENLDYMGTVTQAMASTTPEYVAKDVGLEIHPGALKYFEEAGLR